MIITKAEVYQLYVNGMSIDEIVDEIHKKVDELLYKLYEEEKTDIYCDHCCPFGAECMAADIGYVCSDIIQQWIKGYEREVNKVD